MLREIAKKIIKEFYRKIIQRYNKAIILVLNFKRSILFKGFRKLENKLLKSI